MSARGGTPSDRPTPATEIGTRRSKSPFCCVATTRAFDASSPTSSRRALAGTRSSLAHVLRASGAHSSRAPSLGNSPRYCYRSVPRRLPFRDRYCSAPAAAAATAPRPFSDRFHSATVLQPQPLLLRSAAATTTAPFRDRYHYRFATALLRNRSATATAPQRLPRPRPRNRCVRVPHARLLDRQRPHFLLRKITVLRSLSRSG